MEGLQWSPHFFNEKLKCHCQAQSTSVNNHFIIWPWRLENLFEPNRSALTQISNKRAFKATIKKSDNKNLSFISLSQKKKSWKTQLHLSFFGEIHSLKYFSKVKCHLMISDFFLSFFQEFSMKKNWLKIKRSWNKHSYHQIAWIPYTENQHTLSCDFPKKHFLISPPKFILLSEKCLDFFWQVK